MAAETNIQKENAGDLSKSEMTDTEGHAKRKGGKETVEVDKDGKKIIVKKTKPDIDDADSKDADKNNPRSKDKNENGKDKSDARKIKTPAEIKALDTEFTRPVFRKQFLAEEPSAKLNPNITIRPNPNIPQVNERPQKPQDFTLLQQQQNYSWREKVGNLFKPAERIQSTQAFTKQTEKPSEAPRQQQKIEIAPGAAFVPQKTTVNPEKIIGKEQPKTTQVKEYIPEKTKLAAPVIEALKQIPAAVKNAWPAAREKTEIPPRTPGKPDSQPQKAAPIEIFKGVKALVEKIKPAVLKTEVLKTESRLVEPAKSALPKETAKAVMPPELKTPALQNELQKTISALVNAKFLKAMPMAELKLISLIKESPEIKRFVEHIIKQDPKPSPQKVEQIQRMTQESFRIVVSNTPPQTTPEQVRKVINETISKIGALYGMPARETPPAVQQKAQNAAPPSQPAPSHSPAPSAKQPPKDSPHFNPGQMPPPSPGTAPAQAREVKPLKTGELEEKGLEEKREKERDLEKRLKGPKENEDLYAEYIKRIKEERDLIVQRVYTISGVVLDKKTEKGIEGVHVNGGWMGTALTNAMGEFSFHNVPERKVYSINFSKRGYKFTPSSVTDTVDGPHKHYIYGIKRF